MSDAAARAPRAGAVLFDLDGTLLDTAPDLAAALNRMRARRGMPPVPAELCRPQASHGTRGVLRIGFEVVPEQAEFAPLRDEFLRDYANTLTRDSPLFPGMGEVLRHLEAHGLPWGVVTNKPARYTEPLLAHHGLAQRAACIVSGDTCAHAKPHPEPLLHACRIAGIDVDHCIDVGDAQRDIQAARAAGMPALLARYGYLDPADSPETWGAQDYLDAPGELLDWLWPGA